MISRTVSPAAAAILAACVLLLSGPGVSLAGADEPRDIWRLTMAAGYDTYVQNYSLAADDTTEIISEYEIEIGAEAATRGRARHNWLLRPVGSVGTELFRGRVEGGYRYRPDSTHTEISLDAMAKGRSYRGGTGYSLSSDRAEGELRGRWLASAAGATAFELALRASRLRHREPSELEVDRDDLGLGALLCNGSESDWLWRVGGGWGRRVHPDSAAVDRTNWVINGEADRIWMSGAGLRAYGRGERRLIRDEEARPSAWTWQSELEGLLPAGDLILAAEINSEIWNYVDQRNPYFDSVLLGGRIELRGGGVFGPGWRVGPSVERFDAGDNPESYSQFGIRVGLESYTGGFSGSFSMEVGRREYDGGAGDSTAETDPSLVDPLDPDAAYDLYSDFTYVELWLNGSLSLAADISLDVLAHYQPENHAEQIDDTALGFGSARLVWRF